MTGTILFVEKKEILHLIKQALLNENKEDLPLAVEFVNLELGEGLYHSLCEMIAEGFLTVKKLKTLAAHHQEVHPGTYTGMVHHLVFYQWWAEKENNRLSLLQMWADIGSDLVRGHYFTNGNKRTALLAILIKEKILLELCLISNEKNN